MRVLVTGAAGFIGSNLVHLIASERPDWEVTALDSLTYAGNLENLAALLDQQRIKFVKIDIADSESVNDLFASSNFDLVFHLAAESHVDRSLYGAAEFIKTNVLGTHCLLNSALENRISRFVHISTDEVYGSLGSEGFFYETTPLDPTNPYAASKAASDLIVLSYYKTHNFDVVVTRCTNNYGPYQFPEKLIPLFITNAFEDKHLPLYGDGMNIRSWIYVTDHCRGLIHVAEDGRAGEIYNIGCLPDSEITNKEVTGTILSILNKPDTLIEHVSDRPAHDRRYAVDFSKIKNELGWQPNVHFQEGIEKTIDWYSNNRSWWEKIKSGEYVQFYEKHYANRV
jgi:dTDP-glucose 4,6-dehydratase